jgi:GNAT superfamily N-acetyltransferase
MTLFGHRRSENGWHTPRSGVHFRRGVPEDEFATFNVMARAMNYEMNWPHHAATRHHLRTSPQVSFWVAEETQRFGGPKIVGYARSLTREGIWNLAEFFVLPDYQRRGIGGTLLAHCLEEGQQAGATTRFVLASHHAGADSLYVRLCSCFPRLPMLLLAGPTDNLRVIGSEESPPIVETVPDAPLPGILPAETLTAEPLVLTPEIQGAIDALDREIVGFARPTEHRHWSAQMGGPSGSSRLFRRLSAGNGQEAGSIVGYAYIGTHSSGPALARDPADLPRMIAHVAALSRTNAASSSAFERAPTEIYLAIAGTNETMLRWLLECGWQIVFQYLFMSTHPFGRFDRYVCYNPLYFI